MVTRVLAYSARTFSPPLYVDARYINTKLNCSDMLTKAVSVETATTLGPMLSGEVPLPAMPEPEDTIKRF